MSLDWNRKEVLVCGGAGMIGSHLARELLKKGARVTIADNLSSGSKKNIEDMLGDVEFCQVDLREVFSCLKMTKGRDCIFQLAANMGGIGYITAIGADIMRDSALINLNMLESARKQAVPYYFYSSSACVYPGYRQESAKVTPLKEEHAYPADPDQFYGWEKLFTEKVCEAYRKDYQMNTRVARFHNVYGAAYTAFDKKKAKAPCHLIIKAMRHPSPPFELWGDGKATRSFLYIADCVDAILRLMGSDHDEPINIGSDRLISVDGLAEIIIKISGKAIVPKHDLSKPQGVRGRNADLTLVRKVLDWEPKVSLEEGLAELYHWAEKHFSELENI
jgi:GDP-D-mannose 3',5'-epimerase